MLKRLQLENFTVFAKAEFEFGPGLNVVVGTNGTGKSHVLKVGYAVLANIVNELRKQPQDDEQKEDVSIDYWKLNNLDKKLETRLEIVFQHSSNELVRRGSLPVTTTRQTGGDSVAGRRFFYRRFENQTGEPGIQPAESAYKTENHVQALKHSDSRV